MGFNPPFNFLRKKMAGQVFTSGHPRTFDYLSRNVRPINKARPVVKQNHDCDANAALNIHRPIHRESLIRKPAAKPEQRGHCKKVPGVINHQAIGLIDFPADWPVELKYSAQPAESEDKDGSEPEKPDH
jgi:hypothetical protein